MAVNTKTHVHYQLRDQNPLLIDQNNPNSQRP